MNDKLLGLLGIARRSGNLKIGFEACDEAIKNGKAKLVLVASDTAARTEKELRFSAKEKPIDIIRIDADKFKMCIRDRCEDGENFCRMCGNAVGGSLAENEGVSGDTHDASAVQNTYDDSAVRQGNSEPPAVGNNVAAAVLDDYGTVSYTHLDVYKRQLSYQDPALGRKHT